MPTCAKPTGSSWQISAVFPCHNEAAHLEQTLLGWRAELASRSSAHEMIAVDDGSTDTTSDVLRSLGRRFLDIRVYHHPRRMGYGSALRTGLTRARFPLLLLCDSDGQFDPADLNLLLVHIGTHDMVAGYRSPRRDNLYRRALGLTFTTLMNRLFGVPLRDVNCGLKLFWRDRFPLEALVSRGALINAEMVLRAPHARIRQVPVRHQTRAAGKGSGGNVDVILEAVSHTPLLVWLAVSRRRDRSS